MNKTRNGILTIIFGLLFSACRYSYVERQYQDWEKTSFRDVMVETEVPLSLHTSLGLVYHDILLFPVHFIDYQNQVMEDENWAYQIGVRPLHFIGWVGMDLFYMAGRVAWGLPYSLYTDISGDKQARSSQINCYRYNVINIQFLDIDPTNPRLETQPPPKQKTVTSSQNDKPDRKTPRQPNGR